MCAFGLVEIVSVEGPEPPLIEGGLKTLLVWDGKPKRLRLTVPVKPWSAETVAV